MTLFGSSKQASPNEGAVSIELLARIAHPPVNMQIVSQALRRSLFGTPRRIGGAFRSRHREQSAAIQKHLQDPLAEAVLKGQIPDGSVVQVGNRDRALSSRSAEAGQHAA